EDVLVALGDDARLLAGAAEREQLEVTGDELHAHQPLAGPIQVAGASDHRTGGDDGPLVAEQGHEAELAFGLLVGRADLEGAVLALLNARLDDFLESFKGSRANLGAAFVRADVRDGPE